MQQYVTFILGHWELCLAFIAILVFWLGLELRAKLSGLAQVSPQEATFQINHQDAVILDIRDANHFTDGHILGAINIPAHEVEHRVPELEKYKEKPIILVHSPSQPPHKAGTVLESYGFKISNLSGGINAWQNAGLPLVKS